MFIGLVMLGWAAAVAPGNGHATACAVWAREVAFARSVERHDAAAFAQFLQPDAVFIGAVETRGRDAIVAAWQPIIEGRTVVLRWRPDAVTMAAETGDVALSRGAYWMQTPASAGRPASYRIGRFSSIWLRDADGQWHVLFDGGGGNEPKPATAAEVAHLESTFADRCPG